MLNSLNRGMGLSDAYPFVLPTPALDKPRFVHEIIGQAAGARAVPPRATISASRIVKFVQT